MVNNSRSCGPRSGAAFKKPAFRVHVQELPEGWGIDGLIGLGFLRLLNYEVRSLEGRIRAERAAE
jgi:hypothetical protein